MTREFVVVLTREDSLEDAPLFARMVNAAFFLSHDIRRDVILRVVLESRGVVISFVGAKLRHIHVDEQSMLGVVRKIFRVCSTPPSRSVSVHSGVLVEPLSRVRLSLDRCYFVSVQGPWLSEALEECGDVCFVLAEEAHKYAEGARRVRVTASPKPVDTTLVVLNIEIDRLCG